MKNIKNLMLISSLMVTGYVVSCDEVSKRLMQEHEMLKAYVACTQRVMRKPQLFGIDVRSALYDCFTEYEQKQQKYDGAQWLEAMKYIFDKNHEDIKRMQRKP